MQRGDWQLVSGTPADDDLEGDVGPFFGPREGVPQGGHPGPRPPPRQRFPWRNQKRRGGAGQRGPIRYVGPFHGIRFNERINLQLRSIMQDALIDGDLVVWEQYVRSQFRTISSIRIVWRPVHPYHDAPPCRFPGLLIKIVGHHPRIGILVLFEFENPNNPYIRDEFYDIENMRTVVPLFEIFGEKMPVTLLGLNRHVHAASHLLSRERIMKVADFIEQLKNGTFDFEAYRARRAQDQLGKPDHREIVHTLDRTEDRLARLLSPQPENVRSDCPAIHKLAMRNIRFPFECVWKYKMRCDLAVSDDPSAVVDVLREVKVTVGGIFYNHYAGLIVDTTTDNLLSVDDLAYTGRDLAIRRVLEDMVNWTFTTLLFRRENLLSLFKEYDRRIGELCSKMRSRSAVEPTHTEVVDEEDEEEGETTPDSVL